MSEQLDQLYDEYRAAAARYSPDGKGAVPEHRDAYLSALGTLAGAAGVEIADDNEAHGFRQCLDESYFAGLSAVYGHRMNEEERALVLAGPNGAWPWNMRGDELTNSLAARAVLRDIARNNLCAWQIAIIEQKGGRS